MAECVAGTGKLAKQHSWRLEEPDDGKRVYRTGNSLDDEPAEPRVVSVENDLCEPEMHNRQGDRHLHRPQGCVNDANCNDVLRRDEPEEKDDGRNLDRSKNQFQHKNGTRVFKCSECRHAPKPDRATDHRNRQDQYQPPRFRIWLNYRSHGNRQDRYDKCGTKTKGQSRPHQSSRCMTIASDLAAEHDIETEIGQ